MASLYQTSKQNIGKHIKGILSDGELAEGAVVNKKFTTAEDGKNYLTLLYSLPMIIAVGYRVRSTRGTQFRQRATRTLGEYMVKGFVMDDEPLKHPQWDYFDELLERIRDIRSSEMRFYQKVRDLFTLAEDYRANESDTRLLFSEVQNKLFFAVTGHTAAELIIERSDPDQPNMGLLSFKGTKVRKADVVVAKNYLNAEELDHLNRLVSMFFDFAELRAKQKQHLRLNDWRDYVNRFMDFNEQPLPVNAMTSLMPSVNRLKLWKRPGRARGSRETGKTACAETEEGFVTVFGIRPDTSDNNALNIVRSGLLHCDTKGDF